MENVADALIMAGQALIFIVALTVCISSFSSVREGVDRVINQTETVEFTRGSQGYINYIQSNRNNATRIVGAETVMSSIQRCLRENYVIYIDGEKIDNNQNIVKNYLTKSFYEKIKDKQYYEYLGEYQKPSSEGVSSENKDIYRIITYSTYKIK